MLTNDLETALATAFKVANSKREQFLTIEHLLLAVFESSETKDVFEYFDVDRECFKNELISFINETVPCFDPSDVSETVPTLGFQRVLQRAVFNVQSSGGKSVTSNDVLVAIFGEKESHAVYLLNEFGIGRSAVVRFLYGHDHATESSESDFQEQFNEDLDYKELFSLQQEQLESIRAENDQLKVVTAQQLKEFQEKERMLNERILEAQQYISELQRNQEARLDQVIRSVEFPPQYHMAGLGILNFFGAYLKERYPNEKAKVKIEQEGFIVRLVVESECGHRDVIERALHEYEMVVTGETKPESLGVSSDFIYELKVELKMTKLRLELTQERLQMQNSRIDQLLGIIGSGLSGASPVMVEFKSSINNTFSVECNQKVAYLLGVVNELIDVAPSGSKAFTKAELIELREALKEIEGVNEPALVRQSSALSKLRRFLDRLGAVDKATRESIEKIGNSIDLIMDLCGKYNSIAEWCGLPQVPEVFTKKK